LAAYASDTETLSTSRASINDAVTALEVADLSVSFAQGADKGPTDIFRGVSFALKAGETVALLGRSGAGKTTLLNAVAGFVRASTGHVRFCQHGNKDRPAFAYVFQEDRLMPWRTAEDNVRLALERLKTPHTEQYDKAIAALERVGLAGAAERYPWQLSGGMRSRVALARALALEAPVVLLDEPFSKLDPSTRGDMHELLISLQRELGFAALLVTHDVAEAVRLADRAIIINPEGVGTMRDLTIDCNDPAMADQLLRSFEPMSSKQSNDASRSVAASKPASSLSVSRRAALGLGFSAAAAGVIGSNRALAQDAPLRIGCWATGIQLALIELIQEKKIFEKYGLKYELVRFADVNGNTLALATDRIDVAFSVSGAGALELAATKRPIKIVLSTQAADGHLVTRSPDIKQVTDLRGKMIGMAPAGSAGAAYTKSFLSRNYGMEPNSYRIAGGGEARLVQLLVQGEVDAALLREVSFVQLRERLGLRSLADQRLEWEKIAGKNAIPPLGVGVVQDKILQNRRKEAVAFIAAIRDGIKTGTEDPSLVSSLMSRSLKLPAEEAKAYADTWPISFHGKFDDADVASIETAQKLFVLEGSLKAAADKSYFDQSVYRDALKL